MKTPLICLPGLGGHPSVFSHYAEVLSECELKTIELVNIEKALHEARAAIQAEKTPVALFCNCYSAQMGIQLAKEMPDKVGKLIFLEPFFSEFQPWTLALWPVNILFLAIVNFFSMLGVRRRRFNYDPDYVALSKYPIYIQPFFDMRWQNLTDYLYKCYDILTYKLPPRVDVPTLMIFSPNGFSRSPATKERLKKVFPNSRIVVMPAGTHNILTMGAEPVADLVREYLKP